MTVLENYDIDADVIYEKSKESDYWKKVEEFYEDVKHKKIELLTHKQKEWLEKIEADMD